MTKNQNRNYAETKFKTTYPAWLGDLILKKTENDTDFKVYEHIVNQAWRHKTDLAEINLQELAQHYDLSVRRIKEEINTLIERKVIIPTDYDSTPDAEFRVPLLTGIFNLYKRHGVAA